jgi:mycothiol synthase
MHAPTVTQRLEPRESAEISALLVRAGAHDAVKPVSEQTVLSIRRAGEPDPREDPDSGLHLVVVDQPGEIDASVLAYAHVEQSEPPSAEVVVDPEHRRQGIGTALLGHVFERFPDARVWAHGDLLPARNLAGKLDLRPVRDLWQMSRPLTGEWSELPEVRLPEGFAIRTFEVGRDEQAWLAVNARAFADHAEQGRATLADLHDRMAEPWFDPHGFLLIEDRREDHPRLVAFHWTKVEVAESAGSQPSSGEVYVVGVDPDYQGLGLGKVITIAGLRHLRACGLDTATLYVDGDNAPAIATYHRLGFERSAVDVMYARRA